MSKRLEQINPFRICALNQIDLPIAPPFLEFLFTSDGRQRVVITLEPNKQVDVIAGREPLRGARFMLVGAAQQIAGYANIKSAMLAAGQDINVVHNAPDL